MAEVLLEFNMLRTNAESALARDNQFAVISPTNHCETGTTEHSGRRPPPGDARFEYYALYLKWFDHWLEGIDNGVTKMPVSALRHGQKCLALQEWPLARTKYTRYYLHSDGHANTRSPRAERHDTAAGAAGQGTTIPASGCPRAARTELSLHW